MIQIQPIIDASFVCPECNTSLLPDRLLWQGIHVCACSKCLNCGATIIDDFPVGHALFSRFSVNLQKEVLYGGALSRDWFGVPFLKSLIYPKYDVEISFKVEKFNCADNIVILNCIDYLYGHALLKLFNAEQYLTNRSVGLVIILPTFLRWLAPIGTAEIWTIDLPLKNSRNYYPSIDRRIKKECERFRDVYLSKGHPHPKDVDITKYVKIPKHNFLNKEFRITFVWREDRPWMTGGDSLKILEKLNKIWLLTYWQNMKVRLLFKKLRKRIPDATYTVAGLGKASRFPGWIDDQRTDRFTNKIEQDLCQVYSESRMVIGVHGSNMLLPSALAGMTIDLMPVNRWGNFAQDIVFEKQDIRVSAFRYRFVPMNMKRKTIVAIIQKMINGYDYFKKQMINISD